MHGFKPLATGALFCNEELWQIEGADGAPLNERWIAMLGLRPLPAEKCNEAADDVEQQVAS